MKLKPILLLVGAIASVGIITTGVNLSAQAQAQNNSQQSAQKHTGKWAALNLTEQQKAQIKEIRQQSRAQTQTVFTPDQLSKLQAAKGQKGNRREVMASLGLSESQKTQLKTIKKSERDRIMAVLTPDQQQQLRSMHKPKQ